MAWLEDIRVACREIAAILDETPTLDCDRRSVLRAAIERHLHIAGEACVRLRDHAPELARELPELRQVIGVRNVLAHLYDSIAPARFAHIARHDVPVRERHVSALLERFEHDPRYRP